MKTSSTLENLIAVTSLACLFPNAHLPAKDSPVTSSITLDAEETAENVTLTGKISTQAATHKGNRFTRITLTLETPITVKTPGLDTVSGIKKVGILAENTEVEKTLTVLAGKRVTLQGAFSHMLTPHTEEVYFLTIKKPVR